MRTSHLLLVFISVIIICISVKLTVKPTNNALKKAFYQTDYYLNLNGHKIEITTSAGDFYIVDPDSLEEFINVDNL